jgi:hypothetical protein
MDVIMTGKKASFGGLFLVFAGENAWKGVTEISDNPVRENPQFKKRRPCESEELSSHFAGPGKLVTYSMVKSGKEFTISIL